MAEITDAYMLERLTQARPYTMVLLTRTQKYRDGDPAPIVWEHGRRNMSLQADGLLPIVCPVTDESDLAGVGIFDRPPEEVAEIMDEDPGVRAGIFTYALHPVRSFPGSRLPD